MSHHDVQHRRRVGFGKFEESLAVAASLFTLDSRRLGLIAALVAMEKS